MTHLDFLHQRFEASSEREAFIHAGVAYTYGWLTRELRSTSERLTQRGVGAGAVVALRADFSPRAVACLLSLLELGAIVLPLSPAADPTADALMTLGQAEYILDARSPGEQPTLESTGRTASHDLYGRLRERGHPGLVLFSSGSTGDPKGVVHDATRLLSKFRKPRQDLRTLAFLLFDHIGGLDTLFYCLSNASSIVFTSQRDPRTVCRLIDRHKIEVLPTAPSFLNLLILTKAHEGFDLSSLRYITYGAEVMPQATLSQCVALFPGATMLQRYGTSEFGALRSRSRRNDSLWLRIDGEESQWRVREGRLEVRSETAMLGYLNAPSPFTEDGWFKTGDCVEVDGEFLRILGRDSDIINVGGQKVFPAEVESAVKEMTNVAEVTVFREPHPMMGHIVACRVRLDRPEDPAAFRRRLRGHLRGPLEPFKIPARILLSDEAQTNERHKQVRRP